MYHFYFFIFYRFIFAEHNTRFEIFFTIIIFYCYNNIILEPRNIQSRGQVNSTYLDQTITYYLIKSLFVARYCICFNLENMFSKDISSYCQPWTDRNAHHNWKKSITAVVPRLTMENLKICFLVLNKWCLIGMNGNKILKAHHCHKLRNS